MSGSLLLSTEAVLRARTRHPDRPVARALVLEYRLPLGCLVHMTPVFEALKCRADPIHITVATRGLGLHLLRHSPFVDRLIQTPDPLTALPAAVLALRAAHPDADCVLTGVSDQRTRVSLLALLAAGGWRGGYTQKPFLYHRPLENDPGRSLIANNLGLARMLGSNFIPDRPRVFFSAADAEAAALLLRDANPSGLPVAVFVTQNSGGQSTGWHTDRWAHVLARTAGAGFAIVYVGTSSDVDGIDQIRLAAGGIGTSIAGRTSVTQLAAVLALSDLAVSLDTGTMHVGRAAAVPMVVLGPSWQKPIEWLPLGVPNVRILRGEDRPTVPPNYRLDEISAESVVAAIEDLAHTCPPSPEARANRRKQSLSSLDHLA